MAIRFFGLLLLVLLAVLVVFGAAFGMAWFVLAHPDATPLIAVVEGVFLVVVMVLSALTLHAGRKHTGGDTWTH